MWLIFLDAGPLSLMTNPRGGVLASGCRRWSERMLGAGAVLFVPEIADYETRRELIRSGSTAGLRRLDQVQTALRYAPITTAAMRLAAELWARVRIAGRPTASDAALDGDAILAAQALLAAGPDDRLTVATTNAAHLLRFVDDARPWQDIEP